MNRKVSEFQIVPSEIIAALAGIDSCTISNVIEQLKVRLRNEGFMNGSVKCQFPHFSPKVGYAVTGRIRTSSTPLSGRCYYESMDWWSYVVTVPAPRFIVLKDSDHVPGIGAFIGEIHANIARALDCRAYVSNGSVRDLPGVAATGLQVFAGNVSVSHAYAHVTEFGEPVEVGGLLVKPGDLLHGDQHGVVSVPISVAGSIPEASRSLLDYEKELIDFCHSPQFSLHGLSERIERRAQPC